MSWSHLVKMHELARGPVRLTLAPDTEARAQIAKELDLEGLPQLTAEVTVRPWLDGVEVAGRFRGVVTQICGVTLEAFDQPVDGDFEVRAVPQGSPNAAEPEGAEVQLDPDSPDAPDVLASDAVDVAAYVMEHLALELDPFPRKPGASFDYQPPEAEASPFAALKALKEPKR